MAPCIWDGAYGCSRVTHVTPTFRKRKETRVFSRGGLSFDISPSLPLARPLFLYPSHSLALFRSPCLARARARALSRRFRQGGIKPYRYALSTLLIRFLPPPPPLLPALKPLTLPPPPFLLQQFHVYSVKRSVTSLEHLVVHHLGHITSRAARRRW